MSSLTTISSGMEDTLEVEDLVETRLCLSLSLATGAGSRPPPPAQALLPASPPPGAPACTKRKGPESGTVGSTATPTTRRDDKKARTVQGDGNVDDNGGEAAGGGARKKLRLTGDQAALLESSFRANNVLSHDVKHGLARELGLKPRQVEVWFQNRRARTKLKQTELDCDLLRRWCERLSHDNERLRLELAEARSSSSTFLSGLTAIAPVNSACPSCKKLSGGQVWTEDIEIDHCHRSDL